MTAEVGGAEVMAAGEVILAEAGVMEAAVEVGIDSRDLINIHAD